ncbi:MAG: LemA family protein [Opitutales bacterium]|nr:LemA family protein [Opitutales bacterium]
MANQLDEMTGPTNAAGRDVNVIEKQLPARVGFGSLLFEIALWLFAVPGALVLWAAYKGDAESVPAALVVLGLGLLPGVIFLFMKIGADNYFRQLEQKIQSEASEIDNYLEQRVQILQNVVGLVNRAIDLDKDVMKAVAAYRSGMHLGDGERNMLAGNLDTAFGRLFPQVEAYPELKAHNAIADAMQQNSYLQREITAARSLYNDSVSQWNRDIFAWPTKMIVAARRGYHTRIPFTASAETKAAARAKFF